MTNFGNLMPQLPISVQLYTVRAAIADDLPAALRRIAGIGYTTVELFDFVGREDEYAVALADAGLTASSGHARLAEAPDVAPAFAAARALGIGTLIAPHIPAERWQDRESIADSARRLNAVALRAADEGVRVGYHNHWWELESRVDGHPALEVFADLLDPRVVLEVDVYWAEVGGMPAPELLARLGERVQLLHVKDGPRSRDAEEQVAVGSGEIDIPAVLVAAPQAQRVVELDGCRGDVFDALADSLAYLTGDLA